MINADFVGLYKRISAEILTDLQEAELSEKKKKMVELGALLKRKQDDQQSSKKFPAERKR